MKPFVERYHKHTEMINKNSLTHLPPPAPTEPPDPMSEGVIKSPYEITPPEAAEVSLLPPRPPYPPPPPRVPETAVPGEGPCCAGYLHVVIALPKKKKIKKKKKKRGGGGGVLLYPHNCIFFLIFFQLKFLGEKICKICF
jgi:hypothetical protein